MNNIDDALDIMDIREELDMCLEERNERHIDVIGWDLERYLERKGMQHADLVDIMDAA